MLTVLFTILPVCFLGAKQAPAGDFKVDYGEAMDLKQIGDEQLRGALEKYYELGLGGRRSFSALSSLLLKGEVFLGDDQKESLEFTAFRKKPDLVKLRVRSDAGWDLVKAFDGNVAWMVSGEGMPSILVGEDRSSLVCEAAFVSHLLYPSATGKRIELLGFENVGGMPCYRLEVTLPSSEIIVYHVDVYQFRILRAESFSKDGDEIVKVDFFDHKRHGGAWIPFHSRSYRKGELIAEGKISSVSLNVGLDPWMFEMPDSSK